jgi:hypothetical protein
MVEFRVPGEKSTDFLKEFADALKLWVSFQSGNEPAWVMDMTGSRDATVAFSQCIVAYGKPPASATQPTGLHRPSPTARHRHSLTLRLQ